ncbi:type II toxin-antitoxin system MqsA family antitoxin [Rahnella inusitata]|uniref:type II toxin-antitoxin system MqsA family antitoxin n=1 Tax=Rahnella inusitata TaxID=58169 RepID=UPI0039BDEC5C
MMIKNKPCPICGAGHLTRQSIAETITYKGITEDYLHVFSVCDVCRVEQADAEEMKLNKRSVIKAKKMIDGLLTGEEVRDIRKNWCISQDDAARIFGGGPKAFSKYENDDVSQAESMDKLIRLAVDFPEVFARLKEQSGLTKYKGKVEILAFSPRVEAINSLSAPALSMSFVRRKFSAHFKSPVESAH